MKWHNLKIFRCPNDGTVLAERYKNSYYCKSCKFGISKERFDDVVRQLQQSGRRMDESEERNLSDLNNL